MSVSLVMAITSALLLFVLGQGPTELHNTPEWQAYQQALRGASTYHVRFQATALGRHVGPRWAAIWVRGHREVVLDTPTERIFWDGKLATHVDRLLNKVTRSNQKPALSYFDLFGVEVPLDRAPDQVTAELWRLTRENMAARNPTTARPEPRRSTTQVGWRVRELGIDTSVTWEYWFDPMTHLLESAEAEFGGMGGRGRLFYRFDWELEPTLAAEFFVPKTLKADEMDIPPATKHSKTMPMRPAIPGYSRITVPIPKGARGAVSIGNRDRTLVFHSRAVSDVTARVQPDSYEIDLAGATLYVTTREGYESVVDVGALDCPPALICTKADGEFYSIGLGSKPVAIFAGTYYIKRGDNVKRVVVRPGETTKVRYP